MYPQHKQSQIPQRCTTRQLLPLERQRAPTGLRFLPISKLLTEEKKGKTKSDKCFMENEDCAGSQLQRMLFGNLFTPKIWSKYTASRLCLVGIMTELLSHCLCRRWNQSGGGGGAQSRMHARHQRQLHEAEEVSRLFQHLPDFISASDLVM